jgi:hypothetical protein
MEVIFWVGMGLDIEGGDGRKADPSSRKRRGSRDELEETCNWEEMSVERGG